MPPVLLAQFITIATIHLLAVMSPGPDFVLISRNSLVFLRKTGIYTSLGLALGILVHVTYSIIGIGYLVSKSVLLFSIIKYIGAGYLFYIGYKSLTAKRAKNTLESVTATVELTPIQAVKMGFITNVTNPKVTLFFLSLFTQIINPATPIAWQILYGLEMAVVTFLWFALVATLFSVKLIKERFSGIQYYLEKVMGGILMAFGIKLALSKVN